MPIEPPVTKKIPTTEMMHGVKLIDDYRWLEDNSNPVVQKWVDSQNKYTDKNLNNQPDYNKWKHKVERFVRQETHGMPYRNNGVSYYTYQSIKADLPTLMIVDKNGVERPLLDIAKMYKNKSVSFDFWSPSYDNKLLVYWISVNGNEISTLRIRDIATGKDLDDQILNVNGSVNWLEDSKSFFYTRGPIPGTVPDNQLRMNDKLYIHKIGEPVENDELIFGDGCSADEMIQIRRRFGAPYLAISVTSAWSTNDIYLYNIENGQTKPLFVDRNARFDVDSLNDRLIINTNLDAPNSRIISIMHDKINSDNKEYVTLIPETDALIDSVSISKSRLFVGYLRDASTELKIFDYNGKISGKLPAPDICEIYLYANPIDDEVYYSADTMVQSGAIYKLDAISLKMTDYYHQKLDYNPDDYIIKRQWVTSGDGTRLPIFIVHKKNLKMNSLNSTIMYGYGGFNSSSGPSYLYSNMAWLDSGGIYVIAVIRGGGEYGQKWHSDGMLDKKQNVFDDFIACAEYLQSHKYTDNKHLAIYGGSNGGLLVGAVSMQRPDLFKAVVCAVPLLDMIHFQKLLIASRWTAEYGDPENADDFHRIIKWSPYHNLDDNIKYPAFFIRTADNDTRVHPMHSYKMTAKLQNVKFPNVTLLRLEKNSGHTRSIPTSHIIKIASEQLTFMAWQLGLDIVI